MPGFFGNYAPGGALYQPAPEPAPAAPTYSVSDYLAEKGTSLDAISEQLSPTSQISLAQANQYFGGAAGLVAQRQQVQSQISAQIEVSPDYQAARAAALGPATTPAGGASKMGGFLGNIANAFSGKGSFFGDLGKAVNAAAPAPVRAVLQAPSKADLGQYLESAGIIGGAALLAPTAADVVGGAASGAVSGISSLGSEVESLLAGAKSMLTGASLSGGWKDIESLASKFSGGAESIGSELSSIFGLKGASTNSEQGILPALGRYLGKFGSLVGSGASKAAGAAGAGATDAERAVFGQTLNNLPSSISDLGSELTSSFGSGLSSLKDELSSLLGEQQAGQTAQASAAAAQNSALTSRLSGLGRDLTSELGGLGAQITGAIQTSAAQGQAQAAETQLAAAALNRPSSPQPIEAGFGGGNMWMILLAVGVLAGMLLFNRKR